MVNYLTSITQWLRLNEDKTSIFTVGSNAQREKILSKFVSLTLQSKLEVKNLGVILDYLNYSEATLVQNAVTRPKLKKTDKRKLDIT